MNNCKNAIKHLVIDGQSLSRNRRTGPIMKGYSKHQRLRRKNIGYSMTDSEKFIAFNFQIFSRIIPFQLTLKGVKKALLFSILPLSLLT